MLLHLYGSRADFSGLSEAAVVFQQANQKAHGAADALVQLLAHLGSHLPGVDEALGDEGGEPQTSRLVALAESAERAVVVTVAVERCGKRE